MFTAVGDQELRAAEQDLQDAVAADPSLAIGWYKLSELYYSSGRFVEAGQAARRAVDADAYLADARDVITNLLFTMLLREQYDDASYWCEVGLRRFPRDPNFVPCQLRVLGWSAQGSAAIERGWRLVAQIERSGAGDLTTLAPIDHRLMVAAITARTGLRDSAQAILRSVHRLAAGDSVLQEAALEEAWVRQLLGERTEALRLIEVALTSRPQMRQEVAQLPWFRSLRTDTTFLRLVAPRD